MNKMDSSVEESALTYSEDIYAVMNDEPIYDEDVKKCTKHHSKKTSKFVEQVQPISSLYSTFSSANLTKH